MRAEGARLVEEYLRLPDGWAAAGGVPEVLPAFFDQLIEDYPGDAVPPDGDALLSMDAQGLAGQVLLVRHDAESAQVQRLHVRAGRQRQGRGLELMRAVLDLAGELGYGRVVLDVMAFRAPAVRLYEQLGFRPIEPYAERGVPSVFLAIDLSG